MSKHTDRNRTPLKDPKQKQKKKATFKQAVDKIKKRNVSDSSNSSDSYSHSSDSSSDSSSNSRGHSSRSSSNDSHSNSLERYQGGRPIAEDQIFDGELHRLSMPYINNMKNYKNDELRTIETNFSANRIKGSGRYVNSDVFPTASRRFNYRRDWERRERGKGGYDKYGNDNPAIFDSERVGRNAAYNDFVTKNRAAGNLTVDRNAPHSVNNLRKTTSRSPSSKGQGDYSEMESLMRLSGKERKYGKNNSKTFADIIKNNFNKNKITEHYISERDACTQHGTDGGCNKFLRHTLPNGSMYYYTVPKGEEGTTVAKRDDLENALRLQKQKQSVDRRIERTSQFKQNPQILKQPSEAEIRAKIQNFENIKKAKQAAKEARNKQ